MPSAGGRKRPPAPFLVRDVSRTHMCAMCRRQVCGMNGATGDLPWPLSFKLVPDAEEIERENRTSFRLSSSGTLPGSRL